MYVCLKIYIRRALNKVTDAPRSQTNQNVFNARLKRSEVGTLFQILASATANSDRRMYCWYVERRTSQYPTTEECAGWSQR